MKIVINSLALLFIPVFLFAGYTYAKSNNELMSPEPDSWPFLVEEVLATGEIIIHSGSSAETDLRTISVDLDVNPYPEDRLSSFPELGFGMGGKITLYRAPSYTVMDGKKSTLYRSWVESVGELLNEKNVILGDEDKINFSVDEKLRLNMQIKIIRVARTNVHEFEDIDYDVIEKDDPNLDQGKTRIERYGQVGEKKFTYEVVREDGEQISKTLVGTEITKDSVDEILIIGTKITSYGTGTASWYIETSRLIAACNFLPKGTKVRVVNLSNGKSVIVECVGGGMRGDRIIDLSTGAFKALGASLGQGLIKSVRLEKVF